MKKKKENTPDIISNRIAFASFLVSGAALIVAIFAILPGKAKIEYEKLPEYVTSTMPDTIRYNNALVRLILKNNGGRGVTVERIVKRDDDKGIIGFNRNGEMYSIERSVSMYYIDEILNTKYYDAGNSDHKIYFSFYDGLGINKRIEPGSNLPFNLYFVQSELYYKDIETVVFDASILLSDNRTIPLNFEFDLAFKRRSR